MRDVDLAICGVLQKEELSKRLRDDRWQREVDDDLACFFSRCFSNVHGALVDRVHKSFIAVLAHWVRGFN
jgi:hypothetical protein